MKRIVLVRHSEEPGDDHVQTTLEVNGHAIATAMPFKVRRSISKMSTAP